LISKRQLSSTIIVGNYLFVLFGKTGDIFSRTLEYLDLNDPSSFHELPVDTENFFFESPLLIPSSKNDSLFYILGSSGKS